MREHRQFAPSLQLVHMANQLVLDMEQGLM